MGAQAELKVMMWNLVAWCGGLNARCFCSQRHVHFALSSGGAAGRFHRAPDVPLGCTGGNIEKTCGRVLRLGCLKVDMRPAQQIQSEQLAQTEAIFRDLTHVVQCCAHLCTHSLHGKQDVIARGLSGGAPGRPVPGAGRGVPLTVSMSMRPDVICQCVRACAWLLLLLHASLWQAAERPDHAGQAHAFRRDGLTGALL